MKKGLLAGLILLIITCNHLIANNNYNTSNLKNLTLGDTLTVSFAVNGTTACKSSIESAVTANVGVVSASWDATTKTITISYISGQVRKSDLYTFLAIAGYDNAELRAKKAVYDALPSNCQYTRDPETE
jgi:hypothetical protein